MYFDPHSSYRHPHPWRDIPVSNKDMCKYTVSPKRRTGSILAITLTNIEKPLIIYGSS